MSLSNGPSISLGAMSLSNGPSTSLGVVSLSNDFDPRPIDFVSASYVLPRSRRNNNDWQGAKKRSRQEKKHSFSLPATGDR
jgi:hypothetical protein